MSVDASYDTPNYAQQGGAVWVVNGELRIGPLGIITDNGVQAAAITPVVTTAPTNVSPYGFTQAQAIAIIANLNALTAAALGGGLIA